MADICAVYSTFPNRDEALSTAAALLEKRLIACANIHEVTSIYRWEGAMQKEPEAVLWAKTTTDNVKDAVALIKALHSYDLPCIVTTPVTGGFAPYLQWVAEEVR